MIRVVVDTNVYLSALLFGGLPGVFLDLAIRRLFIVITSTAILDELEDKLRGKFKVSSHDVQTILAKLQGIALFVKPETVLDVIKDDPDDNRILECAVAAGAEYIISGDHHLLDLETFEATSIVSVRQFLDKLDQSKF